MLEVGWSELLVIAIVMIVIVGPKDLPKMLRTFAGLAKKARGMANEFQSQFSDAMREADLDDVRKTISDVRSLNPRNALKDAFDPLRKAGEDVKREMQGLKDTAQNSIAPNTPVTPVMAAPSPVAETAPAVIAPVVVPTPSAILPNAAPAELAPVVKNSTAKAKTPAAKKSVPKTETIKKPRAAKAKAEA